MLCACVSPSFNPQTLQEALAPPVDWDVLLELAEEHSVQGILAKRLQAFEFAGVPSAAREKLQTRMRAQHIYTLSMTAELFRLLDDFAAAGIEILVVKGPVTSVVAYGDLGMRGFGDVDLLLRQRDIASASRLMHALGFAASVPESAIEAGKVPGEYVFRRTGTNRMVEIHTEQTFRYYPSGMPVAELFRRKRFVSLEGREVPALCLSDEIVFYCVHGAKDFWERLMWVSDVAALAENHPEVDWQATQDHAVSCGAGRMLNVGLLLAHRVLRASLPPALAATIERDPVSHRLCAEIETWLPFGAGAPPSIRDRALYRMRIAGGGIAGISYLLRLSLSPTEEDWENGVQRNRSWLWDALRRPFRLIRKYGPQN
ncbi:MAG TPA: nucleotidyltransferase family protein [Candidatus Saccharimonadales bacterium]|nr:nucleotidyltransferase family protein [Candidatus Saccharimonadales bacterium]